MVKRRRVDRMDQNILRILSTYRKLTALELWYEFGEDDWVKQKTTEGEILSRLESLTAKGFVERVTETGADGGSVRLIFPVRTGDEMAGKTN